MNYIDEMHAEYVAARTAMEVAQQKESESWLNYYHARMGSMSAQSAASSKPQQPAPINMDRWRV